MVAPNTIFSPQSYVPILKSKQSEFGALGAVNSAARDSLIPLVEARDGSGHADAIAGAWPDPKHIAFVQPLNLEGVDEAIWAADTTELFDALRSRDVAAVPVVTPDASVDERAAVSAVIATDGRGACVRIDAQELALATPAAASAIVDDLLAELGVVAAEVDLLIDVGLVRDAVASRVATAESVLNVVPHRDDWRNVIVAFSAFPEAVGDVAAASAVTSVERQDAIAFDVLRARNENIRLTYGDYTVGVPFYADIPWAPVPNIRYARDDLWIIHRAATKVNPSPQWIQLASDVAGAPYFAGPGFSAGDQYLYDVASGLDGPGNPMTYLRAAISHHIAHVQNRLATLGVP